MTEPPAYHQQGGRTRRVRSPLIFMAVLILVAVIALYAAVDPESPYMPHCMLKILTGYDCPGCGAQRSLHALLHGHVGEAWRYNAAIFALLPLLALYGAVELAGLRSPRLTRILYHPLALYAIAAAILLWWLLRNTLL